LTHRADLNAKDSKGQTPLDLAALNHHKDVVELLQLRKGDKHDLY
jgi:ankyrin repeat protein